MSELADQTSSEQLTDRQALSLIISDKWFRRIVPLGIGFAGTVATEWILSGMGICVPAISLAPVVAGSVGSVVSALIERNRALVPLRVIKDRLSSC